MAWSTEPALAQVGASKLVTAYSSAWRLTIDQIAHNDFPRPTIPLYNPPRSSPKEGSTTPKPSPRSQTSSQTSQKENQPAPPSSPPTVTQNLAPTREVFPPEGTLPPPLLSLLSTIQATLRNAFSSAPPHTAQRLAELILRPTLHYRTLPSYLRALDRIVSVSSPLSVFPLPTISSASPTNNGLLNGVSSPEREDDENLSGATLTPIPWLRRNGSTSSRSSVSSVHPHTPHNATTSDLRRESTTQIDGPNGAGSIETVTVTVNGLSPRSVPPAAPTTSSVTNGNSVTQGELLRQEQEAGVVPVPVQTPMVQTPSAAISAAAGRITRSSGATSPNTANAIAAAVATSMPEPEPEDGEGPRVHARGPDVIGMEDMGPQSVGAGVGGLDIEGALGRRGEGETMLHGDIRTEIVKAEDGERKDGDGDVVVADADGVPEGEEGADAVGQNIGGDAVDSSAVP